ncbi:hypothetical protein AeRB84_000893 [Aphanomyces euteiches]|nr:hypothetical protein AeRB84_000893 [Aphanomyces euteiches]
MFNKLRGKSIATVQPAPVSETEPRRWSQVLGLPHASSASLPTVVDGASLPFNIYFGSQTGHAEALANRLYHAAKRNGLHPTLKNLYGFDPEDLNCEQIVIFVVATYMDGGPTDNAAHFHFWLKNYMEKKSSKKPRPLRQLRYAVFASGDTKYGVNYNTFGTFVDHKVFELGAARLLPCCLGDCNIGIESMYSQWEIDLFQHILSVESPCSARQIELLSPLPKGMMHRFSCIDVGEPKAPDRLKRKKGTYSVQPHASVFFDHPKLNLSSIKYVVSEPKPPMLHVELSMEAPPFAYQSADTISIYLVNPTVLVEAVASALNYPLENRWIQLIPIPGTSSFHDPFPTPCRLAYAMAHYYELATVSQTLVAHLAEYATDEAEAANLKNLGSDQVACDAALANLSLSGVLRRFPSVRVPLDAFLHIVPPIIPRQFAIASSNILTPTSVHLCISVSPAVTFRAPNISEGFTGASLMDLAAKKQEASAKSVVARPLEHSGIRSTLLPSKFRLGLSSQPIVFVAVGSGFAVVRALMLDRVSDSTTTGKHVIFYGCRTRACVPYMSEIKTWETKVNLQLILACSSESAEGEDMKYRHVQDAVQTHISLILEELDLNQGRLFVCGKAAMVQDVWQLLAQAKRAQIDQTGVEETVASGRVDEWLRVIQDEGRYAESSGGS